PGHDGGQDADQPRFWGAVHDGSLSFQESARTSSGTYFLQRFQELRIFGLETPIEGNVLCWVLPEEDQGVSYVVGLVDGGGDLLHHLLFGCRANARGRLEKNNRHRGFSFKGRLGDPSPIDHPFGTTPEGQAAS